MAQWSSSLNQKWGKTYKGFAAYLDLAGKTIGPKAARNLAAAGAEFMANEDWDWPRGTRYTVMNLNTGKTFRASGSYASGFRGGDAMHPWYSGNLHDSLAVGVIQGTRILAKAQMTPGALVLQSHEGQSVDGVTAGEAALQRAAHTFSAGSSGNTLRAVLVIGVPYADKVNEMPEHAGYVEFLQQAFYSTILPNIESIRKIKLRLK